MAFTDLCEFAREGFRRNEHLRVHSNGVEQFDDIARSHTNASEANGLPDISLLGCAVDVDIARKCVAVPSFEALQPEDARDDRIAAGSIDWQYLAGRYAAFENRSGRHVIADLFSYAEPSERRGVGAPGVAESEFRGGDGKRAGGFSIAQQNHLLSAVLMIIWFREPEAHPPRRRVEASVRAAPVF